VADGSGFTDCSGMSFKEINHNDTTGTTKNLFAESFHASPRTRFVKINATHCFRCARCAVVVKPASGNA
jgi:hypothetical protein